MKQPVFRSMAEFEQGRRDTLDLEALLHPAQAFEHPMNVVHDSDLTLSEKRAILASWASDACAVDAAPALRHVPGSGRAVRFDDVMDALRLLDREAADAHKPPPHYRRVLERRRPGVFNRKQQGQRPATRGPRLTNRSRSRNGPCSRRVATFPELTAEKVSQPSPARPYWQHFAHAVSTFLKQGEAVASPCLTRSPAVGTNGILGFYPALRPLVCCSNPQQHRRKRNVPLQRAC
jgi:hypothetical protein